jgi:hypothetical protein
VLTKRVDYPLGNALNPVSDEQLEGKFNSLVVPALGEKGARELLDAAWKMDGVKTPNELMKLAKMPGDLGRAEEGGAARRRATLHKWLPERRPQNCAN